MTPHYALTSQFELSFSNIVYLPRFSFSHHLFSHRCFGRYLRPPSNPLHKDTEHPDTCNDSFTSASTSACQYRFQIFRLQLSAEQSLRSTASGTWPSSAAATCHLHRQQECPPCTQKTTRRLRQSFDTRGVSRRTTKCLSHSSTKDWKMGEPVGGESSRKQQGG